MNRKEVVVRADVSVDWQGDPPRIRVYVGNELFTERTWIWQEGYYLEEMLAVNAPPGNYDLRWELVPPSQGTIEVKNVRIEHGSAYAYIKKNSQLRITDEST
jgi:hypothetical protein